MLHFMQHEYDTNERANIPEHLRSLARLHPNYSLNELEQAHAQLISYFRLVWKFFRRMEEDGRLSKIFDSKPTVPYDESSKVEPLSKK
jgi:hypothetical protein